MNIFFDVDYTLISYLNTLRPGVRECFQGLVEDGHTVHVWSGVGLRWYVVRQHGLEPLVAGVYVKPLANHRASLKGLGVPVEPDLVVDDHLEVVQAFGGILVHQYYFPDDSDREMEGVYQAIWSYVETGRTPHPRFWPPTNGTG